MKPNRDKAFHRPFSRLGAMIDRRQLDLCQPPEATGRPHAPMSPQQEKELFDQAMQDVTPLEINCYWRLPDRPLTVVSTSSREEEETVEALDRLIKTGKGFDVAMTDEYMEACAPGLDPRITKRLHQGRYAVQDHIDLHGMVAAEAQVALARFVKRSIARGCHAVLIVHGRGLRSPHQPVLKAKVFQWLTRGPLRAHVVALASTRSCDGGAGATIALLRRTPAPKKQRIR